MANGFDRSAVRRELGHRHEDDVGADRDKVVTVADWVWFIVMIAAIIGFVVTVEAWGARTEHALLAHFISVAVGILALFWVGGLTNEFAAGLFG